jgi:glycosyltransferase involved in cell wall biosynthesis
MKKLNKKIGIIGDALAPHFNEACANEMYLLSRELNIPVLTCNDLGIIPIKRLGQYFIVDRKFLKRRNPLLYLLNGAFFYFFIKLFERRFEVILSSAVVGSHLLNYLNYKKCILILNTLPYTAGSKEGKIFAKKIAPKLRGVIAQSQRVRNRLIELGIDTKKICLIYPWIDFNKFKCSEPPDSGEFRILFASAPIIEVEGGKIFREKGLLLLLEAFKEFTKHTNASLWLLWRGCYEEIVYSKIKELKLENKVKVINEIADMPSLYAQCHVTVVPYLNTRWNSEMPLSAVESLACGRPVVTTDVVEVAEIIEAYDCGCVSKPTKEDFASKLRECQINYQNYQQNCRRAAEDLFNLKIERIKEFIENVK